MNIQNVIQDELNKMIEAGTVEDIVKTHLAKTLNSVLQGLLRDYSDFGKQLKMKIGEVMNIDLGRLDVVDYNHVVMTVVKEQLEGTLYSTATEQIRKSLQGYISKLKKAEYNLSEIIEEFINQEGRSDGEADGEIAFHFERSTYGYCHVYFDKDSRKRQYDCEFQFDIDNEGKIYSFQAGDYRPHKGDLRKQSKPSGFDGFLFQLYASQVKVVCDENNVETYWSHD